MPVRDVEAIAQADRMVATVVAALPRRRLAAGRPLAGHPPASHFLRLGRVLQIERHDDVADVTLEVGREIREAAVEGEAVHALAPPERDLAWARRRADVPDAEAALE